MVLNRENYEARVREMIGDDVSDASLQFVTDMMETYNDMESRATGNGEYTKEKFEELDNQWRTKYRDAFFAGGKNPPSNEPDKPITIADLFTRKGD